MAAGHSAEIPRDAVRTSSDGGRFSAGRLVTVTHGKRHGQDRDQVTEVTDYGQGQRDIINQVRTIW